MSFNHIMDTVFNHLTAGKVDAYDDPANAALTNEVQKHSESWLEEETCYVVSEFTSKNVLKTPHLFGLSGLMEVDERHSILSQIRRQEGTKLSKVANQYYREVERRFGIGHRDVPVHDEFLRHWLVNLYVRLHFDAATLVTSCKKEPARNWEHHALICEALRLGIAPARNMGVQYELTASTSTDIKEVTILTSTLSKSCGNGFESVILFDFKRRKLPDNAGAIVLSTPRIEWGRLPLTGNLYRVLVWQVTTNKQLTTRLELPLALLSSQESLVNPASRGHADESTIRVMAIGSSTPISKVHLVRDIRQ